ncbi:hypothetical protein APHAL10511_005408 [Amanita phalloides]|nr:hypothetical protein APHAL10511_005408 [Amanita phalloides]
MAHVLESLYIPVFAGQGTTAVNSTATRQQALRDAELPSCSILLSACFQAFVSGLSTLAPSDFDNIDVNLSDFSTKESLLLSPEDNHCYNPIMTGSTLFLVQVLRYLAFIEGIARSTNSLTPFTDVLGCNKKHAVGILGFSSGILPACVVGSSNTIVDFISRAVDVFRLTLWIGVRSQLYRKKTLSVCSSFVEPSLPWSLVFFGLTRQAAEEALAKFNKEFETAPLYITAVLDDSSVTISGHPGILATFAGTFGPDISIHKTTLNMLYHAHVHGDGVRKQILADIVEKNLSFPQTFDLHTPIRSTVTGELITNTNSEPLIEIVLDLLLTQPVNWHLVIGKTVHASPEGICTQVLNVGPGVGLSRTLQRSFACSRTMLYDLTTYNASSVKVPKQEPIAIIGFAVHMPGARNTSQLWDIIEQGLNTITEIPEHRFKVSDYNTSNNVNKRSMKSHMGNFVDGIDEFDNQFFRISPREAKSMDPQQRILLHTAYEALEDAGYVPNSSPTFRPDRFGCFVGAATHDYVHNLKDNIDVYYSTGTLKAFLSGRLSYAMQLSGPSMVIDTACSSSIAAVYQGARALMNRDCDAAMVGGVNVITSPDMFLGLDRGHFLSPTGQCKPFDSSADGYSRAEGCGIFVLKRLSDALSEQDSVLGVIRGIEVNQSGLVHSITHPHAAAQASLFEQLLENSGLEPRQVNVIEAHGTGTQAGDPCEMESIRRVFCKQREATNPLYVTSIKANIGHLEAASGAAGLAKILLMLRKGMIPRHISLTKLNPRIMPLEIDNIIIPTINTPWVTSQQAPRRAVLNNFGASGSNTALLIEEFSRDEPHTPRDMPFVFGLSAKNSETAEALRNKYIMWLSSIDSAETPLMNIAYSATARRQLRESRLAVSASSKEELIKKLKSAKVVRVEDRDATIVFLFSGQGSQYLGMGSRLYASSPLFKRHIDDCHAILTSAGFSGILSIIERGDGPPGSMALEIEAFQSALLSVQYALAKLWMSWGLKPAAVIGHSLGEYAALVIAGVLTLHGALMIVASRARIMAERCATGSTGMIAVHLGTDSLKEAMGYLRFSSLSIACYNSPTDCVVAGPRKDIETFKQFLDDHLQCPNTVLSVPFGYHSSAMDPIIEDLSAAVRKITIMAPRIPIVSNLSGDVIFPGDETVFDVSYFSRHCVEPVQFHNGVTSLASKFGIDVWIEIGPHTAILPVLKCIPSIPGNTLLLASMHKRHDAWFTLTANLSALYMSGIRVLWREVFSHIKSVSCASLPSYPFTKSKFWVPFSEHVDSRGNEMDLKTTVVEYHLLRSFVQYPSPENGHVARFETPISQLAPFIMGHRVGGTALCPASVYIEQALSGVELSMRHLGIDLTENQLVIRDMEFLRPLVYVENIAKTIIVTVSVCDGNGNFKVTSRADSPEESIHVKGQYRLQPSMRTRSKFARVQPSVDCRIASILKPYPGKHPEMFSTRTIYDIIFTRVVTYSKEYQTIKSLFLSSDGMEGYAKFVMQPCFCGNVFKVHPVFLDTVLHAAGFVANLQGNGNNVYICSKVGAVKVLPECIKLGTSYAVYCSNAWLPEQNVMICDVYAVLTSQPKKVVACMTGVHFRRTCLRSFVKSLNVATRKSPIAEAVHPNMSLAISGMNLCESRIDSQVEKPNDVTSSVVAVICDACNINQSDVKTNADLALLGVDSLMSIEIAHKLRDIFPGTNWDTRVLFRCRTVEQIVEAIHATIPPGSSGTSSSVTSTTVTPSASGASSPRTLVFDDSQLPYSELFSEGDAIKEIISTVLDIDVKDIEDDAEFQLLGLDSLTTIEAIHALKKKLDVDLPSNIFASCNTLRALQDYLAVRSHGDQKGDAEYESPCNNALAVGTIPYPLQIPNTSLNRLPLILIHDGSGLTTYYDRLTSLDRAVWAINNPHFRTADPWDSITEMADYYADRIRYLDQASVIVGGWSFGGVVAYEISLHLQARGIDVRGVLLIDSPDPFVHVSLSDSLINSVIKLDARGVETEFKRLVKLQFSLNTRLLASYYPRSMGASCPSIIYLRSRDGFRHPGIPDVPVWLSDRSDPTTATEGWRQLANSRLITLDIPGHHFNSFHPAHVNEVSDTIRQALEIIERS